jgi:hypothetical protein
MDWTPCKTSLLLALLLWGGQPDLKIEQKRVAASYFDALKANTEIVTSEAALYLQLSSG